MKRTLRDLRALLIVVALATTAGCSTSSSEGGIVGSGISSIQGNIVAVEIVPEEPTLRAKADGAANGAALPTIVVSIDEIPDAETITDAAGAFALDGIFAGTVTLRFRHPDDDQTLGTLVVDIGAGATVVLSDIEIRTDLPDDARVQVRPPLHLNLFGRVTARDCTVGEMEIDDESTARNHFVLRVSEDTEIVNATDDGSVRCEQVAIGDRVTVVEGIVAHEVGVIDIVKLRVQPTDTVPPRVLRVRRRGIVLRTACARGLVHFQDTVPNDLVSAHTSNRTEMTCGPASRMCTCSDMGFGDMVTVVGTRRTDNARTIEATQIHVQPNPAATFVSSLAGDVAAVDCAAQTLRVIVTEVSGDAVRPQELNVALSDDSTFMCFGTLPCSCDDVRARDRIAFDVLVSVDQSTIPQALSIDVVSAARIRLAGTIASVTCAASHLEVSPDSDPSGTIDVTLTRATNLTFPDGSPATCRALDVGTRIGLSAHVERGVPGAVRRNVADLIRIERERR